MSPGRSGCIEAALSPASTSNADRDSSSLPVGKIATLGRRRTARCVWPQPAAAPKSWGRSLWLDGNTNCVATMSSPMARTCRQGGVAAMISIPSGSMTASAKMPVS